MIKRIFIIFYVSAVLICCTRVTVAEDIPIQTDPFLDYVLLMSESDVYRSEVMAYLRQHKINRPRLVEVNFVKRTFHAENTILTYELRFIRLREDLSLLPEQDMSYRYTVSKFIEILIPKEGGERGIRIGMREKHPAAPLISFAKVPSGRELRSSIYNVLLGEEVRSEIRLLRQIYPHGRLTIESVREAPAEHAAEPGTYDIGVMLTDLETGASRKAMVIRVGPKEGGATILFQHAQIFTEPQLPGEGYLEVGYLRYALQRMREQTLKTKRTIHEMQMHEMDVRRVQEVVDAVRRVTFEFMRRVGKIHWVPGNSKMHQYDTAHLQTIFRRVVAQDPTLAQLRLEHRGITMDLAEIMKHENIMAIFESGRTFNFRTIFEAVLRVLPRRIRGL